MAVEVHVGDVGTAIRLTVKDRGTNAVVNVTGATVTYSFYREDRTTFSRSGSVYDGSGGIVSYTSIAGDFDEAGRWKVQAVITLSGNTWHTEVVPLRVYENLI